MTTRTRTAALAAAVIAVSVGVVQVTRGPGPGEPGGSETGTALRTPAAEGHEVRQAPPLRVDSFEVHVLAEGSALGTEGDLLLTFHGQGFQLTARAPRVLIDEELVLDLTEINREGSQLYVAVPRELAERLEAQRFERIHVVNPGGLEDLEQGRATVAATPAELLTPRPGAPRVRVTYADGFFGRETIR